MIKNIVFDMGNVLLTFDSNLFVSSIGVNEKDQKLLLDVVYNSYYWQQLDKGILDEIDFYNLCIKELPKRLHKVAYELIFNWNQFSHDIKGMDKIVKSLKDKGYKLYVLSNASHRLHDYFSDINCSSYFDGLFVSADYLMLKPQFNIYETFFKKFNLKPEECIFIDDNPTNIEAAMSLGMCGIVYHGSNSELKKKLKEFGIKV